MSTGPALLLRCGCEVPFIEGKNPTCPEHGGQPVVRVLRMPAPRITGTAKGPLVKTVNLEPLIAPLTIKPTVH